MAWSPRAPAGAAASSPVTGAPEAAEEHAGEAIAASSATAFHGRGRIGVTGSAAPTREPMGRFGEIVRARHAQPPASPSVGGTEPMDRSNLLVASVASAGRIREPGLTKRGIVRQSETHLVMSSGADRLAVPRGAADGAPEAPSHRRADEDRLDAIMARYALGEDGAFRELHDALAPRVSRFLARLTNDHAAANDLAQETFLRVHRARAAFTRGAAAVPWVYAIARNVFLDHERRRKVQRVVVQDDEKAARAPESTARGPEQAVGARRELDRVRRALESMPTSQREAFILLRFEGLSVSEAAEVLGTTESSVKMRAFRAYEAIRTFGSESAARNEEDPS
jgi:RNA polymerase sigma-70 factor, ECF subfamily